MLNDTTCDRGNPENGQYNNWILPKIQIFTIQASMLTIFYNEDGCNGKECDNNSNQNQCNNRVTQPVTVYNNKLKLNNTNKKLSYQTHLKL